MSTHLMNVHARNRRNDRRKPVRVPALVNDCDAIVTDISLGGIGGMLLPDLGQHARLAAGQRVSLTMPKDHDDRLIFQLLICRLSQRDLKFGAKFLNLGNEQFRLVESYLIGRPDDWGRRPPQADAGRAKKP